MMDVEEREITSETEFRWTLTHRDSPVRVSEEVSRRPHRVVVWAVDHIVSPEVFCQFCLLPGQRETWTRTWTFDC